MVGLLPRFCDKNPTQKFYLGVKTLGNLLFQFQFWDLSLVTRTLALNNSMKLVIKVSQNMRLPFILNQLKLPGAARESKCFLMRLHDFAPNAARDLLILFFKQRLQDFQTFFDNYSFIISPIKLKPILWHLFLSWFF